MARVICFTFICSKLGALCLEPPENPDVKLSYQKEVKTMPIGSQGIEIREPQFMDHSPS